MVLAKFIVHLNFSELSPIHDDVRICVDRIFRVCLSLSLSFLPHRNVRCSCLFHNIRFVTGMSLLNAFCERYIGTMKLTFICGYPAVHFSIGTWSVRKVSDLWPGKRNWLTWSDGHLITLKVVPLGLHTLLPAVPQLLEACRKNLFRNGV